MKRYIHAFAMCQSMFCAIPFPGRVWDEEAREWMLLFLPVVGLEIGGLWAGTVWLCRALGLHELVTGVAAALCPFLLTGGIHLDGFMDVTDAVRSWRDMARRREILKDSHVGSFAVIGVGMLLLAQFAFCASATAGVGMLVLLPGVSRCCSALAVMALPPMSTSQYAQRRRSRGRLWLLSGVLVALLVLGFARAGKGGLVALGCVVGYGLALGRGYRSLSGMNGDVAGYALTIGELCALAVWAVL